jgi:hypothetical protein
MKEDQVTGEGGKPFPQVIAPAYVHQFMLKDVHELPSVKPGH